MKYKVSVRRTTWYEREFVVNLPHDKGEIDAEQAAIEAAYNFHWDQSPKGAEYEVDLVNEIEGVSYIVGEKAIFFSNLEDDEYGLRQRNGQPCTVIAIHFETDADHDPEFLPMYSVRFEDGYQIQAFPEELHGGA
jgi:hypothetical protein